MRARRTRRHHLRLSEAAPGGWRAGRETGGSRLCGWTGVAPERARACVTFALNNINTVGQFEGFHKIPCCVVIFVQHFRAGVA